MPISCAQNCIAPETASANGAWPSSVGIDAEEQMMHDRIGDEDAVENIVAVDAAFGANLADQLVDRLAHGLGHGLAVRPGSS